MQVAIPVGHPVDPRHEPSGRQPAEVVVSLDEHGVGPESTGGNGRCCSGRPAADHQHVAAAVDGGRSGRLLDRRFAGRLHDQPSIARRRSPAAFPNIVASLETITNRKPRSAAARAAVASPTAVPHGMLRPRQFTSVLAISASLSG